MVEIPRPGESGIPVLRDDNTSAGVFNSSSGRNADQTFGAVPELASTRSAYSGFPSIPRPTQSIVAATLCDAVRQRDKQRPATK
jgi:hypothetical protein